jgi:histidine triad (HIT) family protein
LERIVSDCIFCKIVAKDMKADVVFEDDDVVAFRDISPQAPTHVLVIPKRHITNTNDLVEADDALLGKIVRTGKEIAAKEGLSDKGYRLVFNSGEDAGYSVFHVHLHVLGGRKLEWPPG